MRIEGHGRLRHDGTAEREFSRAPRLSGTVFQCGLQGRAGAERGTLRLRWTLSGFGFHRLPRSDEGVNGTRRVPGGRTVFVGGSAADPGPTLKEGRSATWRRPPRNPSPGQARAQPAAASRRLPGIQGSRLRPSAQIGCHTPDTADSGATRVLRLGCHTPDTGWRSAEIRCHTPDTGRAWTRAAVVTAGPGFGPRSPAYLGSRGSGAAGARVDQGGGGHRRQPGLDQPLRGVVQVIRVEDRAAQARREAFRAHRAPTRPPASAAATSSSPPARRARATADR